MMINSELSEGPTSPGHIPRENIMPRVELDGEKPNEAGCAVSSRVPVSSEVSLGEGRIILASSEPSKDQGSDIESAPVCGVCYFLLSSSARPNWEKGVIDHKNFEDIPHWGHYHWKLSSYQNSSQRGCDSCRRIVCKVLQIQNGNDESIGLDLCETLKVRLGNRKPLLFHLFVPGPGEQARESPWQQFQQDSLTGTEAVRKPSGSKYLNYYLRHNALTLPDASYTGSVSVLSRINAWLMECQRAHPTCQPSQNASLPRRILEIDIHNGFFRLVEGGSEGYSYACLSHRWNESTREVSLKQADLRKRKSWTPIHSLPLLFRDVMLVVANTGIRYLWIDCLCIIQDSDGSRDWHQEAAAMADIYENASFTVFATWCSGSDQSLFSTVDDTYCPVPIGNDNEKKGAILRAWPEHPDLGSKDEQQRLDFPLLNRGWVLQEFVLSKKLLLFGKNEVYWICKEASWCLCGITNNEGDWCRRLINPIRDVIEAPWPEIVSQFASMSLTFQQDRLTALAGIASRYGTLHKLTYVAGHWMENLAKELFWLGDVFQSEKPRPCPRVAPTWSWASIDGSVEYDDHADGRHLCKGIEISLPEIVPVEAGIYGQLRSARLPLRILTVNGRIIYGWDALELLGWDAEESLGGEYRSKELFGTKDGSQRFQSDKYDTRFLLSLVVVEEEYTMVFADYAFDIDVPGHLDSGSEISIALWMFEEPDCVKPFNGFVLRCLGEESGRRCYERLGVICQDEPDCWFSLTSDQFWDSLLSRSTWEDLILV